jgi:hypothetical protein
MCKEMEGVVKWREKGSVVRSFHWQIIWCARVLTPPKWWNSPTAHLDVCIEAMALELEIVDQNSMCLDGLGIGV